MAIGATPTSLAGPDGEPPVLVQFSSYLQACMDLCDELEQIADHLPEQAKLPQCQKVAQRIYPIVKQAHDFEERSLHPLLLQENKDSEKATKTIRRLHSEHWEDECYAFELQDALIEFARDPEGGKAEVLGYMLRGFFESVRRHTAFEMEHIVPVVREKLMNKG